MIGLFIGYGGLSKTTHSPMKKIKKSMVRVLIVGIVFLLGAAVLFSKSRHRSTTDTSVIRRLLTGESTIDQHANNLSEDIRTRPELKSLQPWALGLIDRYGKGTLHTNNNTSFWRMENSITLAPKETPKFIADLWAFTNAGWVLPEISIVFYEQKPVCVVIDFSSYGVAVGPAEYKLTFEADKTNQVLPGIYTYEYFE